MGLPLACPLLRVLLGLGLAPPPDQERARLLKRTTAWKQNPFLRPARWVYGCVERLLITMGLADNLVLVLRKKF